MIAVAGGTGRLGSVLVPRLTSGGNAVRVLTRDPARASHLAGELVEVVTANVRDPGAVDQALRGATVLVSAAHGLLGTGGENPTTVDVEGTRNLIAGAEANGVEHVVLVSVYGAATDHPMSLGRAKHAAEQVVRESGLPYTIVAPTPFAELWVHLVGDPLLAGGAARIFGRGRNPINFVSVHDVAALIEAAICPAAGPDVAGRDAAVRDAAFRNTVVEIGGPDNLSMVELTELIAVAADIPARAKHVPLRAMRAFSVLLQPIKPALARQIHSSVSMDTADMTFDATEFGRRYPSLQLTSITDVVARECAPERLRQG